MADATRDRGRPEAAPDARVRALLDRDPDLAHAVADVDRTLIHLAMQRTTRERLRAGVGLFKLAARLSR